MFVPFKPFKLPNGKTWYPGLDLALNQLAIDDTLVITLDTPTAVGAWRTRAFNWSHNNNATVATFVRDYNLLYITLTSKLDLST